MEHNQVIDGIVVDEGSIDPSSFEPKDYFIQLKSDSKHVDEKKFKENAESLALELEKAKNAGQQVLLHRLAFMWEVMQKELTAAAAGFDIYVYREDVVKMIDNIKPANSVRATELESFPRIIPDKNIEDIKRAKDLGVFDDFIVVYTDLTEDGYAKDKKEERAAFVRRNTDPVVFGVFYSNTLSVRHERMYLITDWEDEFCDLTFAKVVEKISDLRGKEYNPVKKIQISSSWINEVVSSAKKEIQEKTLNSWEAQGSKKNNSVISWFKKKIGMK